MESMRISVIQDKILSQQCSWPLAAPCHLTDGLRWALQPFLPTVQHVPKYWYFNIDILECIKFQGILFDKSFCQGSLHQHIEFKLLVGKHIGYPCCRNIMCILPWNTCASLCYATGKTTHACQINDLVYLKLKALCFHSAEVLSFFF